MDILSLCSDVGIVWQSKINPMEFNPFTDSVIYNGEKTILLCITSDGRMIWGVPDDNGTSLKRRQIVCFDEVELEQPDFDIDTSLLQSILEG